MARSLSSLFGGIEESAFQLPQIMDKFLSSAVSSMDRVSHGMLSEFTGPNVQFAKSEDGANLIAKLQIPTPGHEDDQQTGPRRLSVGIVARRHLRIRLETTFQGFQKTSIHTIGLPVHVSKDGVGIKSQEDGSVHIIMRILQEPVNDDADEGSDESGNGFGSFFERRVKQPLFVNMFGRGTNNESEDGLEATEELPSEEDVLRCRIKHREDRLRVKKCMCDATPSKSSKAVCYGSLISKAVSLSRRLGMDDFATSAKHSAIECADGHEIALECLEKIAGHVVDTLYTRKGSGNADDMKQRIRTAIESEDDGPSEFQSSLGMRVAKASILLTFMLLFGTFAFYAFRKVVFGRQRASWPMRLSSVLSQTGPSNEGLRGRGRPPSRIPVASKVA